MIKKILLALLALIVVAAIAFFIFVQVSSNKSYDDIPYPDLKSSTDSAVIAHGEYLVRGPAHCTGCHLSSFEAFFKEDLRTVPLQGGLEFPLGPLGKIWTPNLTPDKETGIGRYEDGQIFRMMRHAVKPNGKASLSVLMPFWNMADDDLVAVVSYLRSMEPVHNPVPQPEWTFMGKFVRTVAPPFKPVMENNAPRKAPAMAATKERGEYLARYVANCVGCHTQRNMETLEATGPEFAGGMEFEPLPELYKLLGVDDDMWLRSPNITPDPNSYLSKFKTVDEWKARFRQGRIIPHSPMDWGQFGLMSDEDLEALYIFLHSLAPVDKDNDPVSFKRSPE